MATVRPIPEGTTCDYCAALATCTDRYHRVYCCSHHRSMWNSLVAKIDYEWVKLAMLTMVAEEANGHD